MSECAPPPPQVHWRLVERGRREGIRYVLYEGSFRCCWCTNGIVWVSERCSARSENTRVGRERGGSAGTRGLAACHWTCLPCGRPCVSRLVGACRPLPAVAAPPAPPGQPHTHGLPSLQDAVPGAHFRCAAPGEPHGARAAAHAGAAAGLRTPTPPCGSGPRLTYPCSSGSGSG